MVSDEEDGFSGKGKKGHRRDLASDDEDEDDNEDDNEDDDNDDDEDGEHEGVSSVVAKTMDVARVGRFSFYPNNTNKQNEILTLFQLKALGMQPIITMYLAFLEMQTRRSYMPNISVCDLLFNYYYLWILIRVSVIMQTLHTSDETGASLAAIVKQVTQAYTDLSDTQKRMEYGILNGVAINNAQFHERL